MDQSDALSTPAARRSAHTAAYRCHARAGYSSFRKRRGRGRGWLLCRRTARLSPPIIRARHGH
eukprot:1063931-Pyramimonas_sp.AAC.2